MAEAKGGHEGGALQKLGIAVALIVAGIIVWQWAFGPSAAQPWRQQRVVVPQNTVHTIRPAPANVVTPPPIARGLNPQGRLMTNWGPTGGHGMFANAWGNQGRSGNRYGYATGQRTQAYEWHKTTNIQTCTRINWVRHCEGGVCTTRTIGTTDCQ